MAGKSQPLACLEVLRARESFLPGLGGFPAAPSPRGERVEGEGSELSSLRACPGRAHVGQGKPGGRLPAQTRQICWASCPSPQPSTARQGVPALTCSQTSNSSTCEQGHSLSTAPGAPSTHPGS